MLRQEVLEVYASVFTLDLNGIEEAAMLVVQHNFM